MTNKQIYADVFSDLHSEFFEDFNKIKFSISDKSKYVILAGDIFAFYKDQNMSFLKHLLLAHPNKIFLYTTGNHEYYNAGMKYVDEKIKSLEKWAIENTQSKFFYLQNEIYEDVDNQIVFFGSTLWTNFQNLPRHEVLTQVCDKISDFRVIFVNNTVFTYSSCVELNQKCLQAINILSDKKYESWKKVVFTHFPPVLNLGNPIYSLSNLQPYFENNLDPNILHLADIWIYGHNHFCSDKTFTLNNHNIHILSNQLGYLRYNEKTGSYKKKFTISL